MRFTDDWIIPIIEKMVPEGALAKLRQEESSTPVSLWAKLVEARHATEDQILQAAAARFRFPVADFQLVDPKVKDSVPEQLARRFNVMPIRITDSYLEVATSNPFDIDAEKGLAFATGREVRIFLAGPGKIKERLEDLYRTGAEMVSQLLGNLDSGGAEVTQLSDDDPGADLGASPDQANQPPVVRLVDLMLSDGIISRASDIHVEPGEGGVVVRYRIDGVLRQVMNIPRSAGAPLISRIKIMSGLDIADRLRPQDGRARVAVNGSPVDLRVSTLPATHGEKVVIRILNAKATVLSLQTLGLSTSEQTTIQNLLSNKEGIILVTGPTGSGKTTTLYSCLRMVQNEGVNIVTVEDPVEFRLGKGIVQVQVHEKAGLTFSAALRSILRQDPDVVLVGEIRDQETAQIAVQASLTGHLVLSTLHTNDAANAVTRLVDMGMEAYKIASALRGVVAQRLLRRLCPNCREVCGPDHVFPDRMKKWMPDGITFYKAVGCPDCAMTGYRGRFSIVEVLKMNPELERRIGAGATADKIAEAARVNGMLSLFESGLAHVLQGETSVEELLRVVEPPSTEAAVSVPSAVPSSPVTPQAPPLSQPPMAMPPGLMQLISGQFALPMPQAAPTRPEVDLTSAFELLDDSAVSGGIRDATVLLVDDEDTLRRVMKDLLEREGYTVAEARDGMEALDEVDRRAPDVIVLDLNLPGMDGYTVLGKLRSRPATRNVPIIVLTAKGDEDNEVRVFELGANDFLTKPFRARALSARLEAVLARRKS
ncbi:MAG TPA: type II/IV secretion system protein [Gemmatimonadales bacterium]|nr:type II/IV secretion system protein [Gemmatimonadales bacterium]